ncbi:MAG: hypothetical protein OHK0046_16950 [Anaerolineae bacterium]
MASTILATFDSIEHARDAVRDLTDSGFDRSDIGLAVYDVNNEYGDYVSEDVKGDEGAGFGATFGSIFGALVGLAAITLPGIGPVIAAGPLAAAFGALAGAGVGAAAGAVTGGITASLIKMGVPEEEAHYYAESVRRGSALVSVTATEFDAERAERILQTHNPVDLDRRVAQWRARGWNNSFDPKVDPYTAEDLTSERETYETNPDSGTVRRYPRT